MQQKCKQLPLGRLNMNIYDFHLNDRNVEMQDTLKILGVILDSKLKPHLHGRKFLVRLG